MICLYIAAFGALCFRNSAKAWQRAVFAGFRAMLWIYGGLAAKKFFRQVEQCILPSIAHAVVVWLIY
jgi:hypothetical protein